MFGGLSGSFLNLAFLQSFLLVTSPALLDEKFRGKFEVSPKDVGLIRARLENCALVIKLDIALDIVKDDPDDNRMLECAVTGEAYYVVSGDRHLLKLGEYKGISVLIVRQFMDTIEAEF